MIIDNLKLYLLITFLYSTQFDSFIKHYYNKSNVIFIKLMATFFFTINVTYKYF